LELAEQAHQDQVEDHLFTEHRDLEFQVETQKFIYLHLMYYIIQQEVVVEMVDTLLEVQEELEEAQMVELEEQVTLVGFHHQKEHQEVTVLAILIPLVAVAEAEALREPRLITEMEAMEHQQTLQDHQ